MHRLIYLSQATKPMSAPEIATLAAKSQQNNGKVGVTGLLVFIQGRFFQVLEGPQTALDSCFKRIQLDKRHADMRLISSSETSERAFPDWKMSLFYPDQLPPQAQQAVLSINELMPMNSEARGNDPEVRLRVRDFLASFQRLAAA